MRLVLISDTHLHPHKVASKLGGLDRLEHGLTAVRKSLDKAAETRSVWALLGDIKLKKNVWDQRALAGLIDLLSAQKYKHVEKVIISGNGSHDGVDKESTGATCLVPLSPLARTFSTPEIIHTESFPETLALWPWQPTKDGLKELLDSAFKSGCRILLGHAFLQGARLGPSNVVLADTPYSLEDFGLIGPPDQRVFDWAFFGDIHKHQVLGDSDREKAAAVYYCGSPYAQNWGERETEKGFLVFDSEEESVELIDTGLPKFMVFTEMPDIEQCRSNFVRIIAPSSSVTEEQLKELREAAAYFEFVPDDSGEVQAAERRSDITLDLPPKKLLSKYIETVPPPEGLGQETVLKYGYRLWRLAE